MLNAPFLCFVSIANTTGNINALKTHIGKKMISKTAIMYDKKIIAYLIYCG